MAWSGLTPLTTTCRERKNKFVNRHSTIEFHVQILGTSPQNSDVTQRFFQSTMWTSQVLFEISNLPTALHLQQCRKLAAFQHYLLQAQMRCHGSFAIPTWTKYDQFNIEGTWCHDREIEEILGARHTSGAFCRLERPTQTPSLFASSTFLDGWNHRSSLTNKEILFLSQPVLVLFEIKPVQVYSLYS